MSEINYVICFVCINARAEFIKVCFVHVKLKGVNYVIYFVQLSSYQSVGLDIKRHTIGTIISVFLFLVRITLVIR